MVGNTILKCTIEAATEFSFGVVDPDFFKSGERGKIRHFLQHACQLGKLYGLKLKTFSESRFEGCIDSGYELIKNPLQFIELYRILKAKLRQKCRRIFGTVKWNWAIHVIEVYENPAKLSWVYAFVLVSKNVFVPAFASRFREKVSMHTSIRQVVAIFKRLKIFLKISRTILQRMKKKVVDKFWQDHMDAVLHYAYKEYDPNSKRYQKCLHKWSRFSSCSKFAMKHHYYCENHYMVHTQFQQSSGKVHKINDYFPPHADSLYSRRLTKYGGYALSQSISSKDIRCAQSSAYNELARLMVLPRYKASMVVVDHVDLSGINITDLLGKHFEERVMAMIELFASALWRSSQEFLGEYFTIWNQIGCLSDPVMCHKIAFVLKKAFSSKNLEETKRLVVESYRDRNLQLKDLENGLSDKWCRNSIPNYRGRLHILSTQCQLWRNQIAKLSTNPAALFSRYDPCYSDFESLRNFLLDTKPVVTDQMNEEMIKPAKHLSRQSLSNLDALSWKLVGMFNDRITFKIVENYRGPIKTKLFSDHQKYFHSF